MLKKNILSLIAVVSVVSATPVVACHGHGHHRHHGHHGHHGNRTAQVNGQRGQGCAQRPAGRPSVRRAVQAAVVVRAAQQRPVRAAQPVVRQPACANGQCRR